MALFTGDTWWNSSQVEEHDVPGSTLASFFICSINDDDDELTLTGPPVCQTQYETKRNSDFTINRRETLARMIRKIRIKMADASHKLDPISVSHYSANTSQNTINSQYFNNDRTLYRE